MHYRMNNSNDYGHLRVRSNIVRLRGSQILSRVYLFYNLHFIAVSICAYILIQLVRSGQSY